MVGSLPPSSGKGNIEQLSVNPHVRWGGDRSIFPAADLGGVSSLGSLLLGVGQRSVLAEKKQIIRTPLAVFDS